MPASAICTARPHPTVSSTTHFSRAWGEKAPRRSIHDDGQFHAGVTPGARCRDGCPDQLWAEPVRGLAQRGPPPLPSPRPGTELGPTPPTLLPAPHGPTTPATPLRDP